VRESDRYGRKKLAGPPKRARFFCGHINLRYRYNDAMAGNTVMTVMLMLP
jgi:hypothetical protein